MSVVRKHNDLHTAYSNADVLPMWVLWRQKELDRNMCVFAYVIKTSDFFFIFFLSSALG